MQVICRLVDRQFSQLMRNLRRILLGGTSSAPLIHMTSIFLATVLAQPRQLTVKDVTLTQTFAGKRGHRVVESITASDAHGTVTIDIFAFHTNVAGGARIAKKGDRITVTLSNSATHAKVSVSDVKF